MSRRQIPLFRPVARPAAWGVGLLGVFLSSLPASAQQPVASECSAAATRAEAARCVEALSASWNSAGRVPQLDPTHTYTLPELIDLAENASPETRIAWASARRSLEAAGIARASYVPLLSLVAIGADSRTIVPFPKPLAPRGYVTAESPAAVAQLELQYTLLDFGRGSRVQAADDRGLGATLQLGRTQQQVATLVADHYYRVHLAEGELTAARQILKTAQTLAQNAHAQFNNGRATLPDLQNADAGVAEAEFELATATGAVDKAKLALTEAAGVEPTTDIAIAADEVSSEASTPEVVDEFVREAWRARPDLLARMEQLKAAQQTQRSARSAYLPEVRLHADAGQTSVWPTADYGQLGPASVSTWDTSVEMRWRVFDGARKHEIAEAAAEQRSAAEELRRQQDAVTREVWSSYVDYRTAREQEHAAQLFLTASQTSYDSSLDAFNYGVRSLVDVVQAEKQLAQARVAVVRAHAARLESGVALALATGRMKTHIATSSEVQP